jgi:rhamnogalacturonan endolyase
VAYLDGKTPCLVLERGTYNLQKLRAYQLRDGRLERLWNWNNLGAGKAYWGQGAHTIHAADMDGDGRDEVVIGSSVLDDDGTPLWSTGYGHIDQCFVGDIDPSRPGLEMFYTAENGRQTNGVGLVDARTGEMIWGIQSKTVHVGFGLVSDIDPTHRGCECAAGEDAKADPKGRRYDGKPPNWLFSAQGKLLAKDVPTETILGTTTWGGASRAALWNADVQREILAKGRIHRYGGGTYPTVLEGDMLAVADVTGDWREEILTTSSGELRIYSTRIPARDRRPCLMQDSVYRLCVVTGTQDYYSLPQMSACLSSTVP